MANQNKDEEKNKANYQALSNYLQNITLIFFGFIVFAAYILIPYYSQADEYRNNMNILFYVDKMYKNFVDIKSNISDYTNKDLTTSKKLEKIVQFTNTYSSDYENLFDEYKKNTKSQPSNESQFQNIINNIASKYNLTIYTACNKEPDFPNWFHCNITENQTLTIEKDPIVLDNATTNKIDDMIDDTISLIRNVEYHNNITSLVNMTSLNSWNKIVSDWKHLNVTSSRAKLDLASLNNFRDEKYYFPNFSLNKDKLNKKIENQINDYIKKLDTLEYPIIGKVPILNLNLTFLSFPVIIATGFSFLSFQIKKIIRLHKKLELDHKKDGDKLFMSWIDPLQAFPEQVYPLLVIISPLVIFVTLFILITITWYHPEPYTVTSLSNDILFIPKYYREIFLGLNAFGAIVFALSYFQILRAWHSSEKAT